MQFGYNFLYQSNDVYIYYEPMLFVAATNVNMMQYHESDSIDSSVENALDSSSAIVVLSDANSSSDDEPMAARNTSAR